MYKRGHSPVKNWGKESKPKPRWEENQTVEKKIELMIFFRNASFFVSGNLNLSVEYIRD